MVFDNADNIKMWISKSGSQLESSQLIDLLPKSKLRNIIFTTRDRKAAVKLAQQGNLIEVQELDKDPAKQLLQKSLSCCDIMNSHSNTKVFALLEKLVNLPLAIVQAAAYINKNGITVTEYLLLFNKKEDDVIDLLSKEFKNSRRYANIKNPVATTWLISFEQISQHNPLAAEYLSFMAYIKPKDIPESFLPTGPSQKKQMDAIGTLDAYSFVIR